MYKAFALLVVAALAIVMLPAACGEDSPDINSKCEKFCDALVESMENCMDSNDCDGVVFIESPSEAREECELACTETIEELGDSDQGAVEDCIECVTDAASDSDDYLEFLANVSDEDECYDDCFDDDPEDDDPWGDLFENDFYEDFDEHYSGGDPDVDVDMDADMDADMDGDMDGDGDADGDADCATDDVVGCSDDYTACAEFCGDDYDCVYDCFDDFCSCVEVIGCDPSDYSC